MANEKQFIYQSICNASPSKSGMAFFYLKPPREPGISNMKTAVRATIMTATC